MFPKTNNESRRTPFVPLVQDGRLGLMTGVIVIPSVPNVTRGAVVILFNERWETIRQVRRRGENILGNLISLRDLDTPPPPPPPAERCLKQARAA